jgi:hypothetical protein
MSFASRFTDNISYKGGNVENLMSVKLGIVTADRQALLNLSILLRCLTMEDFKKCIMRP